jgi:predicted SAM-dependent methyltransferase
MSARWQRWRHKERGRARARQLYRQLGPLKADLGCGNCKRPGFVGVDLTPTADIRWNLHWGLPFPDRTVAEIRSDHCLEHLDLSVVVDVLRECHRVLVPGGVLDFTVPHIDPYLAAYQRRDGAFLEAKINDLPAEYAALYATCFDRIAWLLLRGGEHRSLFDRDSIVAKVRLAGFRDVATRDYDPERDLVQRFSSVYVVARK